jgi:purine-cytosine permease-like protein
MAIAWIKESFKAIFVSIVSSILLILVGIAFFGVTLWVIRIASTIFFGTGLDANWGVMAAAILSASAIIAGAIENKPFRK